MLFQIQNTGLRRCQFTPSRRIEASEVCHPSKQLQIRRSFRSHEECPSELSPAGKQLRPGPFSPSTEDLLSGLSPGQQITSQMRSTIQMSRFRSGCSSAATKNAYPNSRQHGKQLRTRPFSRSYEEHLSELSSGWQTSSQSSACQQVSSAMLPTMLVWRCREPVARPKSHVWGEARAELAAEQSTT